MILGFKLFHKSKLIKKIKIKIKKTKYKALGGLPSTKSSPKSYIQPSSVTTAPMRARIKYLFRVLAGNSRFHWFRQLHELKNDVALGDLQSKIWAVHWYFLFSSNLCNFICLLFLKVGLMKAPVRIQKLFCLPSPFSSDGRSLALSSSRLLFSASFFRLTLK